MTNLQKLSQEYDRLVSDLIKNQVTADRMTGAVGAEEANWCESPQLSKKVLSMFTEEQEDEFVAICSIVNDLRERVDQMIEQAGE